MGTTAIEEVLLISHSHYDLGYTDLQEVIIAHQVDTIRRALDLMDATAELPEEARFRWTAEVTLGLEGFVAEARPEDLHRLRERIAEGRFSFGPTLLHFTELCGAEDMVRTFSAFREVQRAFGLGTGVALCTDINGASWGMVPLLRQMGVEFLLWGMNLTRHGRGPLRPPAPFRWRGPDGSELLVFLGDHYHRGNMLRLKEGPTAIREHLLPYLAQLEERSAYGLPFAVIQISGYQTDNSPPSDTICHVVAEWNRRGVGPRLVLATPEMVRDRLRPVVARLPVLAGEWSDWWSDGVGSSARETAVARRAQQLLQTSEVTGTLALRLGAQRAEGPRAGYPVMLHPGQTGDYRVAADREFAQRGVQRDLLRRGYRALHLFEEHTWASHNSVRDPEDVLSRGTWHQQALYAYTADRYATGALWNAVASLQAREEAARDRPDTPERLVVLNPHSFPVSGMAVTHRLGEDGPTVWADAVPGLSWRVVDSAPAAPISEEVPFAPVYENEHFRITWDTERAAIASIYDKVQGRELVDAQAGPLGRVIREEGFAAPDLDSIAMRMRNSPHEPTHILHRFEAGGGRVRTVRRTAWGLEIRMEAHAEGIPVIRTAVFVADRAPWIDIAVTLVGKEPVLHPESVYVAFPLDIASPRFWIEGSGAVYDPVSERLEDSAGDYQVVQHGVGIGDQQGGVLWGTLDAPLVQLGGIHTGAWRGTVQASKGHLYSWWMNNLWHTNFKAYQGGTATARYRLASCGAPIRRGDVRRFGESYAGGLLALPLRTDRTERIWLAVEPENVLVQAWSDSLDGQAQIVRLAEVEGKATTASLVFRDGPQPAAVMRSDLWGAPQGDPLPRRGGGFAVDLGPFEVATLRVMPSSG